MKIFEIVNTQPGISYTVNDPNINTVSDENGNNSSNVNTTTNVANVSNAAPNTTTLTNPITNGSTLNLPMGPSRTKTAMKVTSVSQPQGANRKRTVTVVDPQKPTQSAQTYDYEELSKAASDAQGS